METLDWFLLFVVLLAALPMGKLILFGNGASK